MGIKKTSGNNSMLKDLIIEAKGDRSIRQYALDAGVNPSIVSRIISGDYKPGVKVLERLVSKEAKPAGDVTLQQLLDAAGYSSAVSTAFSDYAIPGMMGAAFTLAAIIGGPLGPLEIVDTVWDVNTVIRKITQAKKESDNKQAVSELQEQQSKFVKIANGIISGALSENGISYQVEAKSINKEQPADAVIIFKGQSIETWWLLFSSIGPHVNSKEIPTSSYDEYFRYVLSRVVDCDADPKRKISLIVDDKKFYKIVKKKKNQTSLKGYFSVILINPDNMTLVDEVYISSFDDVGEELMRLIRK